MSDAATIPPEIMTYADVAAYLRLADVPNARRTIRYYVDQGKLVNFRVGRGRKAIRFRREDVVRFVATLIEDQKAQRTSE